jgi:hypothetical protein
MVRHGFTVPVAVGAILGAILGTRASVSGTLKEFAAKADTNGVTGEERNKGKILMSMSVV